MGYVVTVHRESGFSFVIFLDDHEPAHVHVFGAGQAKIDLTGATGPTLVWAADMKRSDVRRVVTIVAERRNELLARWREIHG